MYEILAPAGNRECALAAIDNGADALYLGYSAFSARAGAENFSFSALQDIVSYAHLFGVKVYVTMNTLVKDCETEEFLSTLVAVHNLGADAILLQDIFLGRAVHERYPDITLHLSTQAGVNNVYGACLAKEYGFSRVVLARETALTDIRAVAQEIETEVFIQGALCTCLSGQCYLSSFIGGNSGNRGRCKQPCRRKYTYDTGERKQNYALSLSDLSVGEKITDLLKAGVISFKIEGRMRRPEYVAAAVRYYKKLLTGQDSASALSDLKRTYNRGNYTQGLAFGQDKRFLSKETQGHIGEKAGVVKVIGGKYYTESPFQPKAGDGFKILRGGEEVGGATFLSSDKRGFFLNTRAKLKNGDGVFITTDTALNARLLSEHRKYAFLLTVTAEENGRMTASGAGVKLVSEFIIQQAKNSPMSEKEVENCFLKTDEYPFDVTVQSIGISGNCFVPKSLLNGFRRQFFAAVYNKLTEIKNTVYKYQPSFFSKPTGKNGKKLAVIGEDFTNIKADIYIFKPKNYADPFAYVFQTAADGERYLYLPAFLNGSELKTVEKNLSSFDGVYAEGLYGIVCARQWGKKLFAGTGLNITNACDAMQKEFTYYAISKELDFTEQKNLTAENAFVFSAGSLKVMDILYCPFGKKCVSCEKREKYSLTDENGRTFILRRYKTEENTCRFELFNCAHLAAAQSFANTLTDFSTLSAPVANGIAQNYGNQEKLKEILPISTAGHSKKSVL